MLDSLNFDPCHQKHIIIQTCLKVYKDIPGHTVNPLTPDSLDIAYHSMRRQESMCWYIPVHTSTFLYRQYEPCLPCFWSLKTLNNWLNWGCPADLLNNQAVLDPKVHGHTSRAQPVGVEPTSPPTKVVALPTKPKIPGY